VHWKPLKCCELSFELTGEGFVCTYMEDDDSCASCLNTKALFPKIKIRFTTCCGYNICTSCMDGLFQFAKQVNCPGCPKRIEKKEFSEANFDGQNYSREATVRKQVERMLCMTRGDFPTLIAYNDHLEFLTDIVFDMTYGSDEEKAQAEERAKKFYEAHKTKVDENWVKTNSQQQQHHSTSSSSSSSSCSSSASSERKGPPPPPPPRMEIPLVLPLIEGPSFLLTTDVQVAEAARRQYEQERTEHQQAVAISKEAEMLYFEARKTRQAKLRKVCGFKPGYQAQRLYEDAFTDLFYFSRGEPRGDGTVTDAILAVNIESD